jgi:hypothetical protein
MTLTLCRDVQWCRDNVAAGAWQQREFVDKARRDEQGVPIDFTRWYFLNEADAEVFSRRWAAPHS